MKLTYDLHIHTALSPCGDISMTPNNIVNMAQLNELDVIAITDHNTCENVGPIMQLARESGLIVMPGMEIETREEIHVICLFPDIESAYKMQELVYQKLPPLHNQSKIFGEQLLMNTEDDVIGKVDRLLVQATELSLNELFKQVQVLKGAFIPAHIDRPSYSIISNLGMIPSNLQIPTLEISRHAQYDSYKKSFPKHTILQSSDSHELGYIGICKQQLEVKDRSIRSILDSINTFFR